MIKNYVHSIWSLSENYLNLNSTQYSIVSSGRDQVVLYKSEIERSQFTKILHVASFALVFPCLFSLVFSKACRQIFAYKECHSSSKSTIEESNCEALATKDCEETQKWRKRLIQSAQHNIVISGNYCGGESFNEILDCIYFRMIEKPDLKVVIITHPRFLTAENNKKLRKIKSKHKKNFTVVKSPDSYFGTKKITNHSKFTIIDYGKYFIQGGSGIKDNFAGNGILEATPKIQKLKVQDDMILRKPRKKKYISDDMAFISIKPEETKEKKATFIESLLPSNFRDQDFVFYSPDKGTMGKKMFREALFLAFKWDQFNKNGFLSSDSWNLDKLSPEDPLFQKYPALLEKEEKEAEELEKQESGNSLYQLLRKEVPKDLSKISTSWVLGFKNKKISHVTVRTFFTGPEDSTSEWEKTLINRIRLAKKRIFIDQMYFQPSKKLIKEMIDAANRGIKVTIVTTIGGRHNSYGEKFFGHRNLYHLHLLFSSVKTQKNVDAYTYSQQATNGLHKKVVVVDDYVLAGSSNMGTKSLELTSDHEMNFEAHSEDFANQTLKVIEEDIKKSRQLKRISLTLLNRICSFIHYMGSRIWG